MAELSEIDGLETYEPQRIEDLTHNDKKTSARISNTYFWEKGWAGRSQKRSRADVWQLVAHSALMMDIWKKSNGSSPTVITDSIFLKGVIEANKNQAMSTLDVGREHIYTCW